MYERAFIVAGYNRIVLVGNLTRDPEYKQLTSGQAVCRLGLATNRQFKNRQTGALVQEVCYVDIDVWGAQAESCRQYLKKGRSVLIEGRLKFDTWEDPNGGNRSKHSIVADRVVFLSSASNESEESFDGGGQNNEPASEMEKELMGQINDIKSRQQKKKQEAQKSEPARAATGEIDFKDSPPFEDNLPF